MMKLVLRDVGDNHVAETTICPISSTIIANLISDQNQVEIKTKMRWLLEQ